MNLFGLLATFMGIVEGLVPIVIGLAVLYFMWGALQYVRASDTDTQIEAKNMILHGIIVLFVIVSVWGLVNLIVVTFQIGPSNLPTQTINVGGSSSLGGGVGGSSGNRIFCWGRNC